jgi:hypothetical protein
MEKDGKVLDPDTTARAMMPYGEAGLTTFDMADHYGSAEIIAGRYKAIAPSAVVNPASPYGIMAFAVVSGSRTLPSFSISAICQRPVTSLEMVRPGTISREGME